MIPESYVLPAGWKRWGRLKYGWAYLAAIIDGHSRKIVGFSVNDHMRVELVSEALTSAYWRERPEKRFAPSF